jgi:hypothetical protein
MRKLYLSIYILGVLMFFLSFFGNTIPSQMTAGSKGSEVEIWEPAPFRHVYLVLDPLLETYELVNVINLPSKYTHEKDVYRYEDYLNNAVKRVVCSIPASIGWLTIIISVFLIRKIWKQTIKRKATRYLLRAGSIFILLAVPILAFNFYKGATTREIYFHLGTAAYLIVFSYLFIGVSLICLTLNKKELS